MKERIKGAFTKKKIFHFLKMALFVVALSLILLSLLGTVAHATGLVDDTINAENLYSKYPLSNYQLDFYVDNSWSWLPWNWLDGIGKSVQYGLYCITNFVWTIRGGNRGVKYEVLSTWLSLFTAKKRKNHSSVDCFDTCKQYDFRYKHDFKDYK